MKRGTPNHPKTRNLAEALGVPLYAAVGLLECLWQFAATYATAGDVGRWSDAEIARGIGWDGDPAALIEAMAACRWLDLDPDHRLIIHDWHEHADDAVQRQMARAALRFATGQLPSLARLNPKEREIAEKRLREAGNADAPPPACAQNAHNVRTKCARNALAPPRPAPPSPAEYPPTPLSDDDAQPPAPAQPPSAARQTPTHSAELHSAGNGTQRNAAQAADDLVTAVAGSRDAKALDAEDRAAALARPQLVADLCAVFALDGPGWRRWVAVVVGRLGQRDALGPVLEAAQHAADCRNPKARQAKDLGKLKEPRGFGIDAMLDACRKAGVSWPDFPDRARSPDKGARATGERHA